VALAKRLSVVIPTPGRRNGCSTCCWITTLPPADLAAFNAWIASGRSITQLWEIAADDPDNPIPVGLSAMRLHIRSCKREP
jgi:hypothetical protein